MSGVRQVLPLCAFLACASGAGAQIADFGDFISEAINDVRAFAREELGAENVGAAYAGLINFAGNPDVSAATYYIDDEFVRDSTLKVVRGSLRHEFGKDGDKWRPFVQALFPYQTFSYTEGWSESTRINAKWKAYGVVGTTGVQIATGKRWRFTPALNFGSVRLESNAGYRGRFAETILAPALDGLAYDWDADAWVAGLTLWMDYERSFETFDGSAHMGVTHNRVHSYRVSDDAIRFSSSATTLVGSVETVHPTVIEVARFPLSVVLSGGGTLFLGPGRKALGFDRFLSAGAALQADIERLGLGVRKVSLGGMGIVGPDVVGWNLIFNYSF